jgi:hypothetical protein
MVKMRHCLRPHTACLKFQIQTLREVLFHTFIIRLKQIMHYENAVSCLVSAQLTLAGSTVICAACAWFIYGHSANCTYSACSFTNPS